MNLGVCGVIWQPEKFDVKWLKELISVDTFAETSNNLNVCGRFKYFAQI